MLYNNGMQVDMEIDLSGLRCPLPVLRVKKALSEMQAGGVLRVYATDPAAVQDIPAFIKQAGHNMHDLEPSGDGHVFWIIKK